MANGNTILVETFGNNPVIRIIGFLIDNPIFDHSKEDMIRELGMSKITFYKYFRMLKGQAYSRTQEK